jgi:CubicO group peptidase (beta-lactamase class C family)
MACLRTVRTRQVVLQVIAQTVLLISSNLFTFSEGLSDQQIASRVQAYLAPFSETGNFSGSVLVARHGRVVYRHSNGMANYELRVPNSNATRYHIASISKAFTAAAILQLQEQGRLKLSDSVARYVPAFPNGDRITIDNLLTHTSGIPDINNFDDYDTFARSPHTVEQLVAKFAGLPLEFAPSSDQRYSNSNYNLLALVLENVTGESYDRYLRDHIFGPAGLRDTGSDYDALRLIPSAASGYNPSDIVGYEKAPYLDWSNKTGNGSLYSTIDDLYRFDCALNTDTLLKSATRQKYFVEGPGNRYGWYIGKRVGHRIMAAKGHSPGFTAELDRFPDDDVTIILLSNSYGTASQDPIAQALAAIVLGETPPRGASLRPIAIPESTLASYAGEYQYGVDYFVPNAKFTLTAKRGFLLMEIGDLRAALVPLSDTEFLERTFFGHAVISKGPDGHVTGLTMQYGDKEFVALRQAFKISQ